MPALQLAHERAVIVERVYVFIFVETTLRRLRLKSRSFGRTALAQLKQRFQEGDVWIGMTTESDDIRGS